MTRIPRKVKKVLREATVFYREFEITDIKIKGKRNTKYKRRAISYIKRTEKLAVAIIERYGLDEFTRKYNESILRQSRNTYNGRI